LEKSRKKFIKFPTLGGGREFLKNFLSDNLVYPAEALKKNIEGDVIVEYRVNNLGDVTEAHVVHGVGYGCDEEALRLVRLLKHQEVKNKGIKVTTNNKIKIPFRMKNNPRAGGIKMTYVAGKAGTQKPSPGNEASPKKKYTYTIHLGNT
jgi:TonB family protein